MQDDQELDEEGELLLKREILKHDISELERENDRLIKLAKKLEEERRANE